MARTSSTGDNGVGLGLGCMGHALFWNIWRCRRTQPTSSRRINSHSPVAGEYADPQRAPVNESVNDERLSLLLVDDDEACRRVLARALVKRGFEVSSAPDVPQALTMAEANPPEYAVIDLKMPGLSGLVHNQFPANRIRVVKVQETRYRLCPSPL